MNAEKLTKPVPVGVTRSPCVNSEETTRKIERKVSFGPIEDVEGGAAEIILTLS